MPTPIGGPRPINTSPASATTETPNTAPVADATPATNTQPAGWNANTTPATNTPSRLERLETRVKGKVVEAGINELSNEHSLGHDFNINQTTLNVKLAEQIALKGSKVYKNLVEPDRLRKAADLATPDSAWVQTRAALGASASFPLGAGASLGFNGGMEVTSIMLQQATNAREGLQAAGNQAKSMVYPLDADGLDALKGKGLAPGSEWLFRGTAGASVGIGVGITETATSGSSNYSASLGAGINASVQGVFTKQVKVLEPNPDGSQRVFVRVGRQTNEALGASVGLNAGFNLNESDRVADRIGGNARVGDLVGGQVDNQLDRVENATRLTASASASIGAGQNTIGQAVLDLSRPDHRAAYDSILRSSAPDAAEYIRSHNLGVTFTDKTTSINTAANLQFGSNNLLAFSTFRGTEQGTVLEAGSSTQLAETNYNRNVAGALPRLFIGEERSVQVRAGSLSKNDGPQTEAVALTLNVKDPRMSGKELAQLQRFSQQMKAPLEGLPTAESGADLGKADYSAQVALTHDAIRKFEGYNADDLRLAFAAAHKDIDGEATFPPYFGEVATFNHYKQAYSMAGHGPHSDPVGERNRVEREYRERFPGRDLTIDMASAKAIDQMVTQVMNTKGKPVEKWGKLLESVGKQPSPDIRASILALRRLADADVVSMSVNVAGVNAVAKPETVAPKTMAEVVGELMAPPN